MTNGRYTQTWDPYAATPGLNGLGAAQWTDYSPPAMWAGYG